MSAYVNYYTGEVLCCNGNCNKSHKRQKARIKELEEENKKLKKLAHDRLVFIANRGVKWTKIATNC